MQLITTEELTKAQTDYRLFLNELSQTTPFSFFANLFNINLEAPNQNEVRNIRMLYSRISTLFMKGLTPHDLARDQHFDLANQKAHLLFCRFIKDYGTDFLKCRDLLDQVELHKETSILYNTLALTSFVSGFLLFVFTNLVREVSPRSSSKTLPLATVLCGALGLSMLTASSLEHNRGLEIKEEFLIKMNNLRQKMLYLTLSVNLGNE